MQAACRTTPDQCRLVARLRLARFAISMLAASCGIAGTSVSASPPVAGPLALKLDEPGEEGRMRQLRDGVVRWIASRQGVAPERVSVDPPDPRLKVPVCAGGVELDQPFGSSSALRARCAEPTWSLFLRAQVAGIPEALGSIPPSRGARNEVTAAGNPPSPRSQGNATDFRQALILSRAVSRGALLSPAAVESSSVPIREADGALVTDAQALVQMEAVRDLPAGLPLRHSDVRPAVLVRLGQLVQMTVGEGRGFLVSVWLEALQDGRMGDQVLLRNRESGRTVTGVVVGPGAARGA